MSVPVPVRPDDAPTRIRIGSHRATAAVPAGRELDFLETATSVDPAGTHRPLAYATGRPGDMYPVHRFISHAADEHPR